MIQWGGLQCLFYVINYSRVTSIAEICKRIDFKNHLTKSEIPFIIESIKKGIEISNHEESKVNEESKINEESNVNEENIQGKELEDEVSFSKYIINIIKVNEVKKELAIYN